MNIFAAIAQSRQMDCDRVQTVKKILTKAALTYFQFCVSIGGRDHPHIDALCLIRSDPSNFALLKRTQQLDLKRQTGPRSASCHRPLRSTVAPVNEPRI